MERGGMSEPPDEATGRIEQIYTRMRRAGGQTAQHDLGAQADEVAAGFAGTVKALEAVPAEGGFYPKREKSFRDLADREPPANKAALYDTEELQAWLGIPRWRVVGAPDLDFRYVDRELVVARAERHGKGHMVADEVRLDALLVNANRGDRTPIVAEIKIADDENALLALIQALTAAAQLSPDWQRQRLTTQYTEHFGAQVAKRLDVYVLTHEPPTRGIRPKLFELALALADELRDQGHLSTWLRRIAFLKTDLRDDELRFTTAADVVALDARAVAE